VTTLFNRYCALEAGQEEQEGKRFDKLFMTFEFLRNPKSQANTGKVSIYNLNKASRSLLSRDGVKYNFIAGYSGLNEDPIRGILSSGDIEEIKTEKKGVDIITNLVVSEDGKKLREKSIDKSFAEGVNSTTIVNELVNTLGVVKGTIIGLKNKVFNSGYVASGKVKDRLDEIAKTDGLEWSVQNGELNILPEGVPTTEVAVNLTPKTGLLSAKKIKVEGKDRITFISLLNPNIKINRQIIVFSKEVEGVYTVRNIKYHGDNRMGPFFCEGEAE